MIHSPNKDIELKNEKGEIVNVSAKNIYQARKNLGHLKAPAGEYTTQIEAIKKKATNISDAIVRSGAVRYEAKMFYDTVFRPVTEYTTP